MPGKKQRIQASPVADIIPPGNYFEQNRAAIFDWTVLTTSFLLGFIFPSLSAFYSYHWFSFWMLGAFLLYMIGAWLKHLPLYTRMIREGRSPGGMSLLLFLLIGHWLILFTVLLFAAPAIQKIMQLPGNPENDPVSGWIVLVNMLISLFCTWLVFRHQKSLKHPGKYSANNLFYRELVADIFLCASVSVLTFAFWQNGIMTIFNGRAFHSFSDVWASFLLLAMAYVLFYLPLRYLYLVEDHSSRQTWRRMLFIFGLLLVRSVFVMLEK